jgi:RsiW-degrading membrane proteinase PrsW (M82 family)
MGLEDLFEAVDKILGPFRGLLSSSPASALALVGISILLVMGFIYFIYGLVKLGRLIWNLRVRSFLLGLTVLGVALVLLSVVLP